MKNIVFNLWLVKSMDVNKTQGYGALTMYLVEKNPHIIGPAQFQLALFKGQLHTTRWV